MRVAAVGGCHNKIGYGGDKRVRQRQRRHIGGRGGVEMVEKALSKAEKRVKFLPILCQI